GSQGSRTLNRAAEESWPLWKSGVRLIHQTGRAAFKELEPKFKAAKVPGEMHPFLNEMPAVFATADVIVSRAGMGAVSELAAAGKPSILIPLPTASDNHQLRNAEALADAGAARLIVDAEWTGPRFVEEIQRLMAEPEALAR